LYTFPSWWGVFFQEKVETLEIGSSGKKRPLNGSCAELHTVLDFVMAVLWCLPQIFETSYRIVKGFTG
jgi:hypothetical protein